jgi:hypothetical protein
VGFSFSKRKKPRLIAQGNGRLKAIAVKVKNVAAAIAMTEKTTGVERKSMAALRPCHQVGKRTFVPGSNTRHARQLIEIV